MNTVHHRLAAVWRVYLLQLACVALLSGCASVPFDYPRTASQAVAPSTETRLGEATLAWREEHGDLSGFLGLSDGIDALGARLRLIELAEATIDAQYFIIKRDRAGALFAGKLLRAADRGVRVRLLVDDIFTPGTDQAFSLLNSHPNVEVRLFNPVANRTFRWLSYAADFDRANRRMHNKSFTVDNSFTIVGGRNIGEEYFELKPDVKFDDFEVLAMGPVVEQVSAGFDEFWNSELSVPMEAFGMEVDPADMERWRNYIREETARGAEGIYARAVNSTLMADIRERRVKPVTARASLITDSPDKLLADVGEEGVAELAIEIGRRFREATQEIIIVTPYFIPQESGAEALEELLQRGVRLVIVTNSLASTNHVPVHSAYTRYRKRLLHAGAEIYEIRARGTAGESEWGHQPEQVTLHSKATLIDRRTLFIGSLNFDPRSILINTEMGLFVESEEVGERFAELLREDLATVTYEVTLNDQDQLRWVYRQGDVEERTTKEPQSSWWQRMQARLYRLLPEGQL
jgi:putative cardiolipin synthase